jgi:hypothetical protein
MEYWGYPAAPYLAGGLIIAVAAYCLYHFVNFWDKI